MNRKRAVEDVQVGQMVKHLEQTGELDNTIIIFQADNGPMPTSSAWPLRGKKTSYAEGGMRNCFNSLL